MSEHSGLPWRAVRNTGVRNDGGYVVFSKDKPFHYSGQDERYERELKEWHGNLDLIALACNSFADLLAACEGAAMNCESMRMECADPLAGELADTAQELRQAIAKARGE